MDGQPLRYRRNADGTFLLYSVGENGKDDGGDPSLEKGVTGSSFYWQNRSSAGLGLAAARDGGRNPKVLRGTGQKIRQLKALDYHFERTRLFMELAGISSFAAQAPACKVTGRI